jgi:hypothetical protein
MSETDWPIEYWTAIRADSNITESAQSFFKDERSAVEYGMYLQRINYPLKYTVKKCRGSGFEVLKENTVDSYKG